ncbi:MAG: MobF family relaxase, partial [Verrucomicrobiota bacterium]
NFHAPKSVSLAISLGKDQRLLKAFRESVSETMRDIEAQTETRIRLKGASEDRTTGNLCWAEFVHLTARPIGGIPDPHTHVHAYTFNTTFDPIEQRWKAAKIKTARREMPLHQARFHARLALKAKSLGYGIQRTRSGWELAGLERTTLDKFSRRTAEIERLAEELHLTSDTSKDKLGALTREGKRRGLTSQELNQDWQARLSEVEQEQLNQLTFQQNQSNPITAQAALDHAIEKVFSRDAVVRRSRLLSEALRYGVGHLSPDQIEREYQQRPIWEKNENGDILITHDEVLAEELALIQHVRSGKGRYSSLVPDGHPLKRTFLSSEQKAAVRHILRSNDRVIALRGGAGTGKTTTMQEIVEAIESTGTQVFALAPSADASRNTLREAGFENADTVAQFLKNPKLHQQAHGQVIWVDEAGLLGTRDLHALTQRAGSKTRIILTGDTHQHAPVARGNAFQNLQKFAGLKPVELTQIRRQEPATYREAVHDLSQKNLRSAFLKLDAMGAIHEEPDHHTRYEKLANDYSRLSHGAQVPLVVSPTRREVHYVTEAIRTQLKHENRLRDERVFPCYRNLQWGSAEKKESENYEPGFMVQYHQNGKGIRR